MNSPRLRRPSITATIICRNEADRIEACLDSIAGWVDEIVVLDSGSTDGTLDIVRRYTDKVWETDWPGFGPQRNRALERATGDWILYIDADERVTPELRAEVDRVMCAPDFDRTLLKMPWRTLLFGKPLRFGRFTSPQSRLFLRRSYEHIQEKHLHYACLLARQKYARGKRGSLIYAGARFFTDFAQQYLLRLSILDGRRGLLISLVLAQYALHKYVALWVLGHSDTDEV